MRTSSLLVLGLVLVSAYVSSAPVEKPLEVAKRDQEMILFGNQQNDPRMKKKKSDPAVPVVVADDSTVDKQGYVNAVPANEDHFIPQEKELADDNDQLSPLELAAEAVIPPIKQQEPENSEETNAEVSDEKTENPQSDTDSVEDELKGIMADSKSEEALAAGETPEVEEIPEVEETQTVEETQLPSEEAVEEVVQNSEVPEGSEEQEEEEASVEEPEQEEVEMTEVLPAEAEGSNPLDDFYYYYMTQKPQDEPSDRYFYDLNYPYPYRRRRSSRNTRAVTEGGMARNDLQRSKRIKRDLFEDENGLYYDPNGDETYTPEVTDEDLYGLFQVDPKYEDEVATLLDMYEQAPEEQPYEVYEPYEQVPAEEVYPELYEELQEEEEEEPQYVPSKRQMLSNLPGIKKRYFYPFNREPQTHWGAFIPEQKRDYDQTYMRLLALASALSEESPYNYEAYKKK